MKLLRDLQFLGWLTVLMSLLAAFALWVWVVLQ